VGGEPVPSHRVGASACRAKACPWHVGPAVVSESQVRRRCAQHDPGLAEREIDPLARPFMAVRLTEADSRCREAQLHALAELAERHQLGRRFAQAERGA
jgi:hypothetical protein